MKFALPLFLALTMVLTIGCGKTDDHTQSLKDQHSHLTADLNSSPAPTPSWSDAQLDAYEQKLNRLEADEHELRERSAGDGRKIADNSRVIAYHRALLNTARQAKKQRP